MTQRDIVELLLATDVYVTPYLDPNQITSGTLSYVLGAGKAVVSTKYLHASEALSDGRGVLVEFRDPAQLAEAVSGILDNPGAKQQLEQAAFAYAHEATWPRSARAFLDVVAGLPQRSAARAGVRKRLTTAARLARRLPENPILAPADVPPSLPGLEVVSVFNAAAARIEDEVVLLLRVGERPLVGAVPPVDALTLDLAAPEPELKPLAAGHTADKRVGIAFLDTEHTPNRVVPVFIPRNTPGLDLTDPRSIRYRNLAGGFTAAADDVSDFLTQMSHLRVAQQYVTNQ